MRIFLLLITFLGRAVSATAEPINEMCPVTPDEPAESWITTEHEGEMIGFCCKSCLRKFNANPEAYLANLNLQASDSTSATTHSETHSTTLSFTEAKPDADAHNHAMDHGATQTNTSGHGSDSDANDGHDYATDHGDSSERPLNAVVAYLGKFHILSIHLPIALLPLAAVFELLGLWRKNQRWIAIARTNFVIGALSALAAAALGWMAANGASYPGALSEVLEWHRWLGASVAFASTVGLIALVSTKLDCGWGIPMYRITAFTLAALVPLTAHFGGSLIYGTDYLF
jgi:uncharacterized membrane protein/YHS domain-containing protein